MYNAQGFAGRGNTASPPGTSGFRGQSSPMGGDRSSGGGGGGGTQGGAKRVSQPIRPVTIKQVLQASHVGDGAIVVDGREASQVTVVGRIVALENPHAVSGALTAKHFGYYVSDGTGTLLVRQWLDQQDTGAVPLPVQTVVRASGTLKIWNELPLVTGSVRMVADSNEITFHLLDSILTHLRITKGPIPSSKSAPAGNPYAAAAAATGAQANLRPGEHHTVTDVVITALKSNRGPSGTSIQQVADYAARYNFSLQEVRAAIKTLSTEGAIYQMDADHYGM